MNKEGRQTDMSEAEWQPDRSSSISLQEQICQYMKMKIVNGEWTVGTKLPSQRTLAKGMNVNRSTVVAALDELAATGFVAGNAGGGTRVIHNSWSLLASSAPTDWNAYVDQGIHAPNLRAVQEINRAEFAPGILRLGTGELAPELLPQAQLPGLFARLSQRPVHLGYEEAKGNLHLRRLLAGRLRKEGISTSEGSILIVSGALQALQLIALGLLQPGSTVLTEEASYLHSLHVFQSAGMRLQGVETDGGVLVTEQVERAHHQHKGGMLYTIPTFQNPTGGVMPAARRRELLDYCRRTRLPVIEDDVYRELWLEEPPPPPLKSLDRAGDVLYLGSLSKTVSPGLRIGWLVGPEPVINRLADIKMQTDYGSSSLSQWAAAEWFDSGLHDQHVERVRASLLYRRDRALDALSRWFAGLADWRIPQGGFYIWLRLKQPVSERLLFERALAEGILLHPGYLYGYTAASCLRLSYSYAQPQELEDGLRRLAMVLRRL